MAEKSTYEELEKIAEWVTILMFMTLIKLS
jgi:hypothetical protein